MEEIIIKLDKESKRATFSCGYATTYEYDRIETAIDLADALQDYVEEYELMKGAD